MGVSRSEARIEIRSSDVFKVPLERCVFMHEMDKWPEIVPVTDDRFYGLVELRAASAEETGERLNDSGWEDRFVTYFRERQQRGASQAFAAMTNELMVGMAFASVVDDYRSYTFGQRSGYINAVYVRPEYRRRGIATHLARAAMAWLAEKRCGVVRLRPSNAAERLYRAMGFTPTRELQCALYGATDVLH